MGHPGYGSGDLCSALVSTDIFVPEQSSPMVGGLAQPDSGSDPQCTSCTGVDHQRFTSPHVPLATRTLGRISHLYFCTENQIVRRYCPHRNGAVLAGTKRHLKSANSQKQSFRLMKMINVSKRQILKKHLFV